MSERLQMVNTLNAVAEIVREHPASCLCPDCRKFCELSELVFGAGDPRICPNGVCDL